jgi:hypothetical protein
MRFKLFICFVMIFVRCLRVVLFDDHCLREDILRVHSEDQSVNAIVYSEFRCCT